jgi:hypothetical protein
MVAGSTGPASIDLGSNMKTCDALLQYLYQSPSYQLSCNGTYSKATQAPGHPVMSIEHDIDLGDTVRHQRQVREGPLGTCVRSEISLWEIHGTTSIKKIEGGAKGVSHSSLKVRPLIFLNSTRTKPRDRSHCVIATSSGATVPLQPTTTSISYWSCAAIP